MVNGGYKLKSHAAIIG